MQSRISKDGREGVTKMWAREWSLRPSECPRLNFLHKVLYSLPEHFNDESLLKSTWKPKQLIVKLLNTNFSHTFDLSRLLCWMWHHRNTPPHSTVSPGRLT